MLVSRDPLIVGIDELHGVDEVITGLTSVGYRCDDL